MQEKLEKIYNQCVKELKNIGIDIQETRKIMTLRYAIAKEGFSSTKPIQLASNTFIDGNGATIDCEYKTGVFIINTKNNITIKK